MQLFNQVSFGPNTFYSIFNNLFSSFMKLIKQHYEREKHLRGILHFIVVTGKTGFHNNH